MASITKRESGKWQARVSWRDNFGKLHQKSKGGFRTKRDALIWSTEQESKLNLGTDISKDISLVDYWNHWVQTYKEPKLSQVSIDHYHQVGNTLERHFGNLSIKKINRSTYQQFINEFGATHAPSTVKKINGFIRSCVKSAILDDYLTKDFTQNAVLVANESRVIEVEYLSENEIKMLLRYNMKHLDPNYTSRYMIVTAIYTGMRLSEIQALTWDDIDFKHQTITIDKSWNAKTSQFKPTKNKSSVRTIKVNQQLLDCLDQLSRYDMVFSGWGGGVPTSNAVNKVLRDTLSKLDIRRKNFHFHSLRHSHVALLLAEGIDIYAISKRLGHSTVSTTADIYAYLIDEYKEKTDNQIIKAL
ncbi:MAG: site-specific integrase, partial [Limosilactobacillus sp.]|nr:site-specific integrase [Limosilactobacillus sp.]